MADQVRRFGPCQRVISYTNLKETPSDIDEIYEEARKKDPDVIKLTCKARTPEEAWPLVQLLAKPPVPTIVVGLGRPGLMLAILGRKIGAPFTLAALEKGMEAYPGQPTVSDLEKVYHYRAIDRQTKLVGVTGVGEREFITTALLNAAFAHLNLPIRCLPLQVGNVKLFRKIIEAVKLLGVVVEEEQQDALRAVAGQLDDEARGTVLHHGRRRSKLRSICSYRGTANSGTAQHAWPGGPDGAGRDAEGQGPGAGRGHRHDGRLECDGPEYRAPSRNAAGN